MVQSVAGRAYLQQLQNSYNGDGLEPCSAETCELWQWLAQLDYEQPAPFRVRGGALKRKSLAEFIFFSDQIKAD